MGFFFPESSVKNSKKGDVSVETLHKLECRACPLNSVKCNTPHMEPSGVNDPIVYILGEAPDTSDDEEGEPFSGKAGRLLRNHIPNKWLPYIRFNNCVRTKPPKGRNPSMQEIECCRPSVVRDIEEAKPHLILALGMVPLNWCIGESQISVWRGRLIPIKVGNHACWLYATFHPAFLLRSRREYDYGRGKTKIIKSDNEAIFERDLRWAFSNVESLGKAEVEDINRVHDGCRFVFGEGGDSDLKKLERWLRELADFPHVAIDIEADSDEPSTRELQFRRFRPYGKKARILSVAIGSYDTVYGFALDHPRAKWTKSQLEKVHDLFATFLYETPNVTKIAHNLSFELEWLAYFYGLEVIGASKWIDTLAQAFVLDERQGALSLDALCLQRFGFNLKDVSNIDVGALSKQPIESVLKYNCLDTKYEHRLFLDQQVDIINQNMLAVSEQQSRRVASTTLTQLMGVDINQGAVEKYQTLYQGLIDDITKTIFSLTDVQTYSRKHKEFNPGSNPIVLDFFRSFLGFSGLESVDEEALKGIDHPLVPLLLEYRTYTKIKSTYVDSLSLEGGKFSWSDGKMHSRLNTTKTRTRRTSSDEPNSQNFPKHNDPKQRVNVRDIREILTVPENYRMVCIDYGQIEFRVFGMATKDKALCEIIRSRYDVHAEWGQRLATEYPGLVGGEKFLNDKDAMKLMRHAAKNKFVFPSLFGARPKSISENLNMPIKLVERVQSEFWNTFPGVLKWQEGLRSFYEKHGYVELLSGFRRHGPLGDGEVINTPIQGTACDIVVNAMDRLSEKARKEDNWVYQPRLMIHDDLTFAIPCHKESTYEEYLATIIDYMLKCEYDFVNVPLAVEVSEGPNWLEQTEVGVFFSDD